MPTFADEEAPACAECVRLRELCAELLDALGGCDAVMDAAALRGIGEWLQPGARHAWAAAHQKARAVLANAKGVS